MKLGFITRAIQHCRTELNPLQWAMALLFLAFCWFAVFGNQGLYTYYSLLNTKKNLITESQTLQAKLDELKKEEKLLHDPRYLEIIIRQELGYIRPGEVIFQLER
ncbi:MAG: hypothetical protein COV45_08590 [Deltaproteobacteria bacterium CG11_big_fil_rev_8_21_14_0_20_47_16]|nr:MAG: hypothetical protein COV45_08590 [Deltaproteobacteria bacterium CG11_big_fil_rev_8_21_14_0_20_47_16]